MTSGRGTAIARHGLRWHRMWPPATSSTVRTSREIFVPATNFADGLRVRSRDIRNARGPYLALEFLNERGQRLAIAHSGAVTDTDREGWEQRPAEGTAPGGTVAAACPWFCTPTAPPGLPIPS